VQLPILGGFVMGIRFNGMLLAVVTTALVIAPASSALAQFNLPGVGGPTATDRMGGGGGGKGATQRAKNLNTSRSIVDRMGGGGGGKGAAGVTTVKSSKSNTSDRMGGGGGKGAVQLNPQPEPTGRR
jgi:hypothetical protein